MTFLVEVRSEDRMYFVTRIEHPGIHATGNNLYAALDEYEKKLKEIEDELKLGKEISLLPQKIFA